MKNYHRFKRLVWSLIISVSKICVKLNYIMKFYIFTDFIHASKCKAKETWILLSIRFLLGVVVWTLALN